MSERSLLYEAKMIFDFFLKQQKKIPSGKSARQTFLTHCGG